MNVWNKFRSTHFVQYFWNISLRTTIINLMVELEEMLGDHQSFWRVHPLEAVNVCTIFHGNQSNTCQDIFIWTAVVERLTDQHCHP